jgi:murein DD-endopeptidase MepM/ murein hydrolase activator NlpD
MKNLVNKSLYKSLNLIVLSVALPSVLMPLVIMGAASASKAEEFKPRQLIAQYCRNIEIRTNRGSRTFPRKTSGGTCGYRLRFQSDGNLVLINSSGQVLWATGTEGRGKTLAVQDDGNIVVYGDSGALWATNTSGNPGAFFAIQSDGNLVVYRSDGQQALWASATDGGQFRTRNAAGEWSGGGQAAVSQPNISGSSIYLPFDPGKTLKITQGWDTNFTHGGKYPSSKYALDFLTNGETGVGARATRAGTVYFAGQYGAFGNTVIIKYVDGMYGFYAHLNSLWVSTGQSIVGGQGVGEIGKSGSGANNIIHLHYEQKDGPNGYNNSQYVQFVELGNRDLSGWLDIAVKSDNPDNRR